MSEDRPKISLVTPCFNQKDLIAATLSSVVDQDYPNLEYVVVDGASTDGSVEIISEYAERLSYWVSEPDDGHYPAVNKGFAKTDGEIMGYLNGDDLLLPGSLDVIAEIFTIFPKVDWITGGHFAIDDAGRPVGMAGPSRWSRWHIISDAVGRSLPQEATFWRRSLWERAGGGLNESFPLAADFELWARFSRWSSPVSVQAPFAAFRHIAGQRSIAQADRYAAEADAIRARERDIDARTSNSLRRANRLLALARAPGFERLRPIVDSVLGAAPELYYDARSGSFAQRVHSGRGARVVRRVLGATLGRRLSR